MFRFLFIIFLIIPIIEIYLLIQVGRVIGAPWTIALVIGTAVLGAFLLRLQGFQTLQRAQRSLASGQLPAQEMLEGLCLVISGALLLTPGFFTDTIGFLLLIPATRQALIKQMMRNSNMFFKTSYSSSFRSSESSHQRERGTIIDGEVVDDDDSRHLK